MACPWSHQSEESPSDSVLLDGVFPGGSSRELLAEFAPVCSDAGAPVCGFTERLVPVPLPSLAVVAAAAAAAGLVLLPFSFTCTEPPKIWHVVESDGMKMAQSASPNESMLEAPF